MTADLHAAAIAALEARRALIEAGTAGPWLDAPEDGDVWGPGNRDRICRTSAYRWSQDAALIVAMHADYSRWLDALEQVLVRHAPRVFRPPYSDRNAHLAKHICRRCPQADWPCPDARSVLAALGLEA